MSALLKLYLTPERLKVIPPGPLKIVVGGDSGGDGINKTVKIGFYISGIPNCISYKNFVLLCIKKGGDDFENIHQIMEIIESDREILSRNGLTIDNHHFDCVL